MGKQNRALRLDASHKLWIEEQPIPRPGEGDVLVQIRANGICGSDIHFYERGVLGPYVVREPYTPGHEACGEIIELGAGVRDRGVGQAVAIEPGIPCRRCRFCKMGRYNQCPEVSFLSVPGIDGTFRDYLTIPADFAHPLPEGMSWEQGACIEPAAVAVHAVNRARMSAGATVAVLGVGPIGLLVIQAALAVGAGRVLALDCQEMRLGLAQTLGATAINIHNEPATEAVLARTEGQGADVVFETAGHSSATALAPEIAATAGVIVQVGWPEIERVPYKVELILAKELDLRGINRYANAFPPAISLVSRGAIRVEPIITHRFAFEQSPTAFAYAHEHPERVIKVVVLS